MKTIDIHSHFYPDSFPDLDTRFGDGDWPGFRKVSDVKGMITLGGEDYRPIYDACWKGERRIEEMDKYAVDVQIMCATPILFAYEKPARQALECAKVINDEALRLCSHNPARLKAMCQVPLQDIDMACYEVSR
ncbi:MAG: amidohydrolase, partial [Kordiimonadaceae bacterium]|nr:amidohydrolase [Kordiimonadaceae bacterium]